jgi:L-lactate dehydrogenase complex protein LldE
VEVDWIASPLCLSHERLVIRKVTKESFMNAPDTPQAVSVSQATDSARAMRKAQPPHTAPVVALFSTCINDVMYPQSCEAAATVLERLGCKVEVPLAQTCCGQIFTNTGYYKEALGSVRSFVSAFSPYDYVVGTSGSCIASVRDQHPMLAEHANDRDLMTAVEQLRPRVFEFTEFLIDILGVDEVGAFFPHTVTFHLTCHSMRMAKLGERPLRLLENVEGLCFAPIDSYEQCCGFGGTFSLKNDAVSVALASQKAASVLASGAEYLVTVDNACALNIGGRLHREGAGVKTIHLAEVLASTHEHPLG